MLGFLPTHLLERCTHHTGPEKSDSRFVLHWMRAALRFDENPTFDVARHIAFQKGLPLVVYQGIDERYPYASYRHHKFLMEGSRDLERNAKKIGVEYFLHVSRRGHRDPVLKMMAEGSAVIVTDLVDLDPWSDWTESIKELCPVIEVDAHCILPRQVFGKSLDRPFRFKNATKRLMKARMGLRWPICDLPIKKLPDGYTIPFDPVSAIEELEKDGGLGIFSECDIDPTVVPVNDLIGGTEFAESKWEKYMQEGLKKYHRTRNNAADREGVSGISPWLHHGMIAATKVVRDAISLGGKGPEKFLDEMLVFREHAYHHCHEIKDPKRWSALPEWARTSWRERLAPTSPREVSVIERGETGIPLWDGAQKGLLRHGVMHNNVRMTWGKAIPGWIIDPEEAMDVTQSLNDRYALDGRNPNSVAGVMWCFGLFDRPFDPPSPHMGRVRGRSTETHASRVDIDRFLKWVCAPTMGGVREFAIVGSGISGLFAAMILRDLGHEVKLYDKGKRLSGRLANRLTSDGSSFQIGSTHIDGIRPWMARFLGEFDLGGPKQEDMSSNRAPLIDILHHFAGELSINFNTRVRSLHQTEEGVTLNAIVNDEPIEFHHSNVLVAIPVEQAMDIIDVDLFSGRSEACWVAWGPSEVVPDNLPAGWSVRNLTNGMIEVRLCEKSSARHVDETKDRMASMVPREIGLPDDGWSSHLWRYSRPVSGPGRVIHHGNISFIGDGFGTPLGTIGGALDSAARAVADMHLRSSEKGRNGHYLSKQTSLNEW